MPPLTEGRASVVAALTPQGATCFPNPMTAAKTIVAQNNAPKGSHENIWMVASRKPLDTATTANDTCTCLCDNRSIIIGIPPITAIFCSTILSFEQSGHPLHYH